MTYQDYTSRWPSFSDEEIEAVVRVLRSGKVNYWTGNEGRTFEKRFADFVGSRHAIALANGSVAIELALKALNVGPGDDVVVTSRSFVASASSVSVCGARPVFADVDRDSQNVTAETIADVLTPATRAIIVVHLGGWPCEMEPIVQLAEERRIAVIEDFAQALGAARDGQPVGSSGSVATWSFCQDKIMTTGGEGGMLTTNDQHLWETAWAYKDHGKNPQKMFSDGGPSSEFKWVHDSVGTNWRMTEMQAAIGNVVLPMVPEWVERRREIARRFDEAFSAVNGLRTTPPPDNVEHVYYKYYLFVVPSQLKTGWDKSRILAALKERGTKGYHGICAEIYRENAFADLETQVRPVAAELADTALMIPVHHLMTDEEEERVVGDLTSVLAEAAV